MSASGASSRETTAPRGAALVIGAYGLIGAALSRALAEDGWRVIGLGRSRAAARRAPWVDDWITADLRDLTAPAAWTPHLSGVSLVVNAAGALDEGPRDALDDVHGAAIEALVSAADAQGVERVIHVSAPGVSPKAKTRFLASKARGDAAVAARAGAWAILRPGLVLAPEAYGGSALLRALAAVPMVLPVAQADALAQTVSIEDVAGATVAAAQGALGDAVDLALVEPAPQRLETIALALRGWLGVAPPRLILRTPGRVAAGVSALADLAIAFGWRTPLSSTSRRVLADGVLADAAPAAVALGRPLRTLDEALAATPPPPGARLLARLYLLRPLLLLTLSAFWLASGLIGLIEIQAAARLLDASALAGAPARLAVAAGGLVDIALGLAVLYKPLARAACLGMIAVTAAYLLGGTLLTPALWLDPLGPLVKSIPAAVLALTALALLEDR